MLFALMQIAIVLKDEGIKERSDQINQSHIQKKIKQYLREKWHRSCSKKTDSDPETRLPVFKF